MTDPQRGRARQYAVCTYALDYDHVTDGAEGVFDQALTNGLAAIVAHEWPGAELDRSKIRSAAGLLNVLEKRASVAGDGTLRVLRPGEPEWEVVPWDDEPMPNFTTIDIVTLRSAISTTQAIRHARDSAEVASTSITESQIEALRNLDNHPALYALTDEMIDRAELSITAEDAAERARARRYWDAIGSDERERRDAFDYVEAYAWQGEISRGEVEECPACAQEALVAEEFDSFLDEIGIGTCVACSYNRSRRVADDIATGVQLRRAVERDD
jgi:hypothetical protein